MPEAPRRTSRLISGLLLAFLAGCAVRPPPLPPIPPETDNGPQCLGRLQAAGVAFEIAPVPASAGGCGVENGVRLAAAGAEFRGTPEMTCAMAARLDMFMRDVVQPAAQRRLGQRVAAVEQFGAFSCRREIGGKGRLSQHAFGRAIDVSGFVLADGSRVAVAADWGSGARGAFLREVARSGCGLFAVVLTPDHDRPHRDHIHLDIGPWRMCGVRAG